MSSILKINTYRLTVRFYLTFIVPNIFITTFLIVSAFLLQITAPLPRIFAIKIMLFIILFLMYFEKKLKTKLILYANFGISKLQLFANCFIIDSLLIIIIYHITTLL
tara:strand:- start:11753 stop:12073 length:321 start_codon:yes stop_codon:yes gene_type:complete